jgi:hypothetical protein
MRGAFGLLLSLTCVSFAGAAAPTAQKVLFFTKSSGFEHSPIKRIAGNPSFALQVLKELVQLSAVINTQSKPRRMKMYYQIHSDSTLLNQHLHQTPNT